MSFEFRTDLTPDHKFDCVTLVGNLTEHATNFSIEFMSKDTDNLIFKFNREGDENDNCVIEIDNVSNGRTFHVKVKFFNDEIYVFNEGNNSSGKVKRNIQEFHSVRISGDVVHMQTLSLTCT